MLSRHWFAIDLQCHCQWNRHLYAEFYIISFYPETVKYIRGMSLGDQKMAESEEEVDVLVQRVVKDITNAFKRNPNM